MKAEYKEGLEASENFVRLARAIFRTKKTAVPKKQPKKMVRPRKTSGSGKA